MKFNGGWNHAATRYPLAMYAKSFGLSQDPFSIAPDPRYLFMSERHREALAHLLYGLGSGGGFVLLSGEIGTGKTTVCRCFLEQIPANCNVAYIFNPKLTADELLRSICDEFRIALPAGAVTTKDFIDPLNRFLLGGHAAGQNNVLIIDEAQNLSADVLEQLRLLTNLETNERKLLQIVLIGQPELRRMLARPELEQLAQRVIARFHLDALSEIETSHYIAHRLAVAGLTGALPFNKRALARIHQLARGIPRRINLLCGRALLGAYASGSSQVDRRTVDKAAAEVFGPQLDARQHTGRGDVAASGHHRKLRLGRLSAIAMASLVGLVAGASLLGAVQWGQKSRDSLPVAFSLPLLSPPPLSPALLSAPPAAKEAMATATLEVASASAASAAAAVLLPATPPAMALLSAADLDAELAATNATNATNATSQQAWQVLGQLWDLTLNSKNPCDAARLQSAACFSSKPTSLALIRQLNRPGIVTLLGSNRQPVEAVLLGLTDQTATLRLGTQTHAVPLAVLAGPWRGDFATLWRVPDGYAEKGGVSNSMGTGKAGQATPTTAWVETQLAQLPGTTTGLQTSSLPDRIYAFQLANGLSPDGQAGPLTLMQLNRAAGLKEPQLKSTPP